MIPSTATRKLMQDAKIEARSLIGGLQKKLNDLEKYKTTGAQSGASFIIQHFPVVGPTLSKMFQASTDIAIDKVYQTYLENSKTPKERVSNSLFVLERYLCATIRQTYNTVADYISTSNAQEVACKNCQDAFAEAKAAYLAQECVDDLKKAFAVVEQLAKDLEAEIGEARLEVNKRVGRLDFRIDNFRTKHPEAKCAGLRKCHWEPGPQLSPFTSFRPKTTKTYEV
jgi:hypothetical protein